MNSASQTLHPFSLMLEPQRVLRAMAGSQQLCRLRRRELHPLDKPLIPYTAAALSQRAAFPTPTKVCVDAALDDYLLN